MRLCTYVSMVSASWLVAMPCPVFLVSMGWLTSFPIYSSLPPVACSLKSCSPISAPVSSRLPLRTPFFVIRLLCSSAGSARALALAWLWSPSWRPLQPVLLLVPTLNVCSHHHFLALISSLPFFNITQFRSTHLPIYSRSPFRYSLFVSNASSRCCQLSHLPA